jgi:hypothetical protein
LPSIDLFVLDTTNDPVTLTLCVENWSHDQQIVVILDSRYSSGWFTSHSLLVD